MRSPRSRQPTPLTSGTQDLAVQLFGRQPEHVLALLRAAWPAAVGSELARRTEVIAMEGRTLRVRVPDAGWRKALHRMRRDILARLRQVAGRLAPSALGFHEGSVPEPPSPTMPRWDADLGDSLPPASVREAAQAIADPDLRERFQATAARYLRRQSRGPDA